MWLTSTTLLVARKTLQKHFKSFYIGSILFQNQVILKRIVWRILEFLFCNNIERMSNYNCQRKEASHTSLFSNDQKRFSCTFGLISLCLNHCFYHGLCKIHVWNMNVVVLPSIVSILLNDCCVRNLKSYICVAVFIS